MPTLPFSLAAALALSLAARSGNVPPCARPVMNGPRPTPATTPPDRDALDAALLQRVAQRDRDAFAALYERLSGPLYGTALRIVRHPPEAQDVVHDAFVTLWEKAATFDPARGSAFSWAVTLVRNRAIDLVRMRHRRAELLAQSAPSDLGFGADQASSGAGDDAVARDEARTVRTAVASLPVEQQQVLELAFFSGLTQAEIAQKLHAPLGTVKARIRRGLLKLRDSLQRRP